jgi:hypothetical protein
LLQATSKRHAMTNEAPLMRRLILNFLPLP